MELDIKLFISQVNELNDTVSKLQYEIKTLSNRVHFLESNARVRVERKVKKITSTEVFDAYWHCSPKQHAVIQMIFMRMTTPNIANRLNVTENGAKSQVRYLCKKLRVSSKKEIINNYEPLWSETPEEEFLQRAKIPKFWSKTYAHLSYEQAQRKDEYFKAICETNYRMPGY